MFVSLTWKYTLWLPFLVIIKWKSSMISFWFFTDMIMQTNFIGGAWVLALKVLIHEYYWLCPLRLQCKKLLIFWCVCTCVVPSEKGPRDIERWELNWLYSLVQKILNALKIALVYKCLIFQFYNWKLSFLQLMPSSFLSMIVKLYVGFGTKYIL